MKFSFMVTVEVDDDDAAEFLGDQDPAITAEDVPAEVAKRTDSTMNGREWAETYGFRFDTKPEIFTTGAYVSVWRRDGAYRVTSSSDVSAMVRNVEGGEEISVPMTRLSHAPED
jgi:hypothetical protein